MKTIQATAIVSLGLIVSFAYAANDELRSGPQAGHDLPGPLAPLAVTGPYAGRFHCPVCENGLYPGVLVFLRELDAQDAAKLTLLRGLDDLAARDRDLHLAIAAIILNDGGYKQLIQMKIDDKAKAADLPLTQAITFKDQRAAQLTALARDAKLQHVEIALESSEGPAGYGLNKDAQVTVVAYFKDRVLLNHAYGKDGLTEEQVAQLLKEIRSAFSKIKRPAARRR